MLASMALKDLHLADLHQRARELGVPRYRMLPREELIEAIEGKRGEAEAPAQAPPKEVASPAAAAERTRNRSSRHNTTYCCYQTIHYLHFDLLPRKY